jgi:hypothetical protein
MVSDSHSSPARGSSSDSAVPPTDIPPPPDQPKWDDAADKFRLEILSSAQASAGVWSGAIATLLGLFGTVALVTGPNDISKLGPNVRIAVITMTITAGVLAGVALILTTIAQQLPSVRSENWTGSVYRDYVVHHAEKTRRQLNIARILGIAAAADIFALGVAVLISSS